MRIGFLLSFIFSVQANALCVNAFTTRLRAEPSGSGKVTWVVGKYMPLVELERKGNWIKVRDLDGDVHWAAGGDLTGRERCVVVKATAASLRTGPGTKFPFADIQMVDRYTAFKRVEAEPEDWYKVEDESGSTYWVSASQVWRATTVSRIGF